MAAQDSSLSVRPSTWLAHLREGGWRRWIPRRERVRQFLLLHSLGITITAGTFVFDLMMPLGVAAAVPYSLLVLLSLRSPGRGLTWFAVSSATLLTLLGYHFSPPGGEPWKVLTNRALALFVIWVTAYLVFEQKRKARQLEVERMARVQSEKLASLGEMAAGIGHELGNPLAALQGRLEMLEARRASGRLDPDYLRAFVSSAGELIERMVRIIRGMRLLARDASADPFQTAPLARVIRDAAELSHHKLRKHDVRLEMGPMNESLRVPCREAQIGQVVVNLVDNAIDAVRELPERWVRVDLVEEPATVEIVVTDSGKGIPRELRDKVFEPFFTTKEVGRGTGLGLSISKSIVEGHGGELRIDTSCPNTRFVVSLPRAQSVGF